MKAEISLALLHDPKILYLDEPTIGLDVLAKNVIRKFLMKNNQEKGSTIILTSHDMKDLEEVCSRMVMISRGKIIFDGSIEEFKNKYACETLLKVTFSRTDIRINHPCLKVIMQKDVNMEILFNKTEIALTQVIGYITGNYDVLDVTVKEPDIEEMVRGIYINNKELIVEMEK